MIDLNEAMIRAKLLRLRLLREHAERKRREQELKNAN